MVDYHYFKSKLNHFYGRYVGYNQRPVFFDIDQTFPELNHITRHFPDIKKEFENVQANVKEFPRYHDIDPGESAISNTTEKTGMFSCCIFLVINSRKHVYYARRFVIYWKEYPILYKLFSRF